MLRLRRLELTEFRQFPSAVIEFRDGLNVITGDNGVGKSTLLEAVLWSLFGAGAVRRAEGSLRRIGASDDVPTSAKLEFEVEGVPWRVVRTLHADSLHGAARLSSDGAEDVEGGDVVNRRIHALIGITREAFLRGCVTGRRELQQLAQLRPDERLLRLASFLGLATPARPPAPSPALREAIAALEEEIADTDRRIGTLASAPDLLAQYEAELVTARASLAEAEVAMDRVQDEWAEKKQDVTTKLDAYRRRADELRRQLGRLTVPGGGLCPTCERPLDDATAGVTARLDDEIYSTAQDTKWLLQRQAQLAHKPPDVLAAETRRARLRDIVDDLAQRAARCEQAMQELWTLATERQRAEAHLIALTQPPQDDTHSARLLQQAELRSLAGIAGQYIARATDWRYTGIVIEDDGRIRAQLGDTLAPVMSGADADLFALALRIATMRQLADSAPMPGLMILDEPFGALDETRQHVCVEMLRELAEFQVVLCTRFREHATNADTHAQIEFDAQSRTAAIATMRTSVR